MVAIRRILVALDFDTNAQRVLDFARLLADACGASLHLLHVIGCPLAGPEIVEQARRGACRRLDALLDGADREHRHVTTSCQEGTIAFEIVRYAAANDIDLIVMGTHPHEPTFRMATASIAEEVLGAVSCPVLAVTPTGGEHGEACATPRTESADQSDRSRALHLCG